MSKSSFVLSTNMAAMQTIYYRTFEQLVCPHCGATAGKVSKKKKILMPVGQPRKGGGGGWMGNAAN